MPWIEPKGRWLPGGNGAGPQETRERVYTVSQFADVVGVSRGTVFKWLDDTDGDPIIPVEMWYKLPGSGHIRIYERAVRVVTGN